MTAMVPDFDARDTLVEHLKLAYTDEQIEALYDQLSDLFRPMLWIDQPYPKATTSQMIWSIVRSSAESLTSPTQIKSDVIGNMINDDLRKIKSDEEAEMAALKQKFAARRKAYRNDAVEYYGQRHDDRFEICRMLIASGL